MRGATSATRCHVCGGDKTHTVMDFGAMAVANAYLPRTAEATASEQKLPLAVQFCETCLVMHVREPAPAQALFTSDYAYFSSYSSTWLSHAALFADDAIAKHGLGATSFVVEIGSNDGYLLKNFVRAGVPCLGIDPAADCASAAARAGVETQTAFFNHAHAKEVRAARGGADLVAANNVLAHVPEVHDFLAGVEVLLAPSGVASFEFPHLLQLIENAQFDTIYHEHYSYFSLLAVERLLAEHGLSVVDVTCLPTHGGSLRVTAARAPQEEAPSARAVCAAEIAAGLDRLIGFENLARQAEARRAAFKDFLSAHKGATVAAYGAAAKGNTFLNYCSVDARDIAFVADKNPAKQGRLTPGTHIPIVAPEMIAEARPDFLVILPWNIREEIIQEQSAIAAWGGAFVLVEAGVELIKPELAA